MFFRIVSCGGGILIHHQHPFITVLMTPYGLCYSTLLQVQRAVCTLLQPRQQQAPHALAHGDLSRASQWRASLAPGKTFTLTYII